MDSIGGMLNPVGKMPKTSPLVYGRRKKRLILNNMKMST